MLAPPLAPGALPVPSPRPSPRPPLPIIERGSGQLKSLPELLDLLHQLHTQGLRLPVGEACGCSDAGVYWRRLRCPLCEAAPPLLTLELYPSAHSLRKHLEAGGRQTSAGMPLS